MPLTLSISTLRARNACSLDERVVALERHLGRPVPEDEEVPFDIWAEITQYTGDLIWATRCWGARGAQIAAEVARRAAKRAEGYSTVADLAAEAAYAAEEAAYDAAWAAEAAYAAEEAAYVAAWAAERAAEPHRRAERALQRADILSLVEAA